MNQTADYVVRAANPDSCGQIRLAVYYAPAPGTLLAGAAARWFGQGEDAPSAGHLIEVDGMDHSRLRQLIAVPRHYGFHATLKPPFALRPGIGIHDVRKGLAIFAAERRPVRIPPLELVLWQDFFCLRPQESSAEIELLAADAVRYFDRFRQPPGVSELARRRATGLTERQEELLRQWGYPYVMEKFQFHLTLTGRMSNEEEQERLRASLQQLFAPALAEETVIDSVSLFLEEDGQPMVELCRCPLG